MIWSKCALMAKRQAGEDALGNPIYDYTQVREVDARHTPWTDDQIALEDRDVTKNEQRYIIRIPYKDFPECQKVEMDGHTLDITQVMDLSPRFTVIQVKSYKQ